MRAARTALRGTAHDGAMSPAPDAAAVEAPTGDDPATAVDATAAPGTDARPDPAVDAAAVDAAATRLEGVVTRTPLERNERLSDRTGGRGLAQARGPAGGPLLQAARRLQPDGPARPGRPGRRRGVRQRRQPRSGAGLRLPAAGPARRRVTSRGPRPGRSATGSPHLGGGAVELVVVGDTYDEAAAAAYEHAATTGATLVPAFDDPRTVAGQGTVAPEVVDQLGGAAGRPRGSGRRRRAARRLAAWLRERHPAVRVVGVEPAGAACMAAALAAGRPVDAGGPRHLRRRRRRPARPAR